MKQSLSIIGVGAFGAFMLPHVAAHFDVCLYDASRDVSDLAARNDARIGDLQQAASCDVVILAVPVRALESVAQQIAPFLKAGQLVMDVASVKCLPAQMLSDALPDGVDIIGLHPLFGPQSGKDGIAGLNITMVNVRGTRDIGVCDFLRDVLCLYVVQCGAEEHDRQMAYVQGLTHMITKIYRMIDVPPITQETKTFGHLRAMVDMLKNDSDALFMTIQTDNPFVSEAKRQFFDAARVLEERLKG